MPGERKGSFVEGGDKNIDSRSLKEAWFVIVKYLKEPGNTGLYIVDPENPGKYSRESGNGELRLDGDSLQVKEGKNNKLIDPKFKNRFLLDEDSMGLLAEYKKITDEAKRKRLGEKAVNSSFNSRDLDEFRVSLRSFGLAEVDMQPCRPAHRLMERILQNARNAGSININNRSGKQNFCIEWRRIAHPVPLPCVPPKVLFEHFYPGEEYPDEFVNQTDGDFLYLESLVHDAVVRNIADDQPYAENVAEPDFESGLNIYVMDWKEIDMDTKDRKGRVVLESSDYTSPMLKALGIEEDGIMFSRNEIDRALWFGDPGERIPTEKHEKIIKDMHLSTHDWALRLIRQDEYSRLAGVKGWGRKKVHTHFDNYLIKDKNNGMRFGLCGGDIRGGGPSHIGNVDREEEKLPVRIVLAHKRH